MRAVIIMPRAKRQLRAAEAWWLKHRDKAPAAFDADMDAALAAIAESPSIYPWFNASRGIRRMLVERVRYYVYYRLNAQDDIEVLSIWHASRRAPRL